ncbi:erythromycin biosynthesis sensory transduction protein eryC1 [Leptolyngbya sp. 'hensonii']|uniref:DegT/DnrJ/EryC1/StrS family aminotransferase n=1 Tax=Leptolyngbya sp. 'hensonii' TaxID=1922337 RepID=UPI00094FF353|nr:DegT/DnrJ/EryC1/StrS family aminotransferase [Leptolyngbya sp. 'hensonii']OLP17803.1 erythromycin biosynthesis sensory transduction protein eryC1 [Leptolyngbya sp. 'hensonii']
MSNSAAIVPFVDLSFQHDPIQAEITQQVQALLERGDFILGQAVSDFEVAFAAACNVPYGIGVASGTEAIALGLRACGIGPGDEVLLPTNTFIATLIGVLQTGATPILVDCDPTTALIDLVAAEKRITPKTRAIVPVHLYGQMVSPRQLLDLASSYDLLIFEDAAQAHMAEREGYRAGAIGVAAAFSFYPSKNLGAIGDGGMVVTQDEIIAQTVRSLRNYGSPRKYIHTDYGINSRLDTLQAAVLKLKLPYLAGWNQARNEIAQQYDALLQPLQASGLEPIQNQSGTGHVYHLYVIRIGASCLIDRTILQEALSAAGIQTGIHYPIPCHLQPAYHDLGYGVGDFPKAEALSHEILSLPMYPGMTGEQVERVVTAIDSALYPAETSRRSVYTTSPV